MKYDLRGKNVVLTGGSRGIGRAVAMKLADEGARTAIAARNETKLGETQAMLEARGAACVAIPCDVTDDASVRSMVDEASDSLGQIDIFMNIAGITLEKGLEDAALDDFRMLMETNLLGTVRCSQAVLPYLKKTQGLLVNVASIIVRTPFPYLGVYACSKWAVAAFSNTLRQELNGSGVRVLTVYPTIVKTDMVDEEPVLAKSPAQSPQQCAAAIIKAMKNGRCVAETAVLPKFLSLAFYFCPPLADRITNLFLPKGY
jgi:short-subunit dehydrogenase